jgi:hypothetical protein
MHDTSQYQPIPAVAKLRLSQTYLWLIDSLQDFVWNAWKKRLLDSDLEKGLDVADWGCWIQRQASITAKEKAKRLQAHTQELQQAAKLAQEKAAAADVESEKWTEHVADLFKAVGLGHWQKAKHKASELLALADGVLVSAKETTKLGALEAFRYSTSHSLAKEWEDKLKHKSCTVLVDLSWEHPGALAAFEDLPRAAKILLEKLPSAHDAVAIFVSRHIYATCSSKCSYIYIYVYIYIYCINIYINILIY